jgi:hypothetical protein
LKVKHGSVFQFPFPILLISSRMKFQGKIMVNFEGFCAAVWGSLP